MADGKVSIDVNEIIREKLAAEVIASLSDEQRDAFFRNALEEVLSRNVYITARIKEQVQNEVLDLVIEKLQSPDAQARMHIVAQQMVDKFIDEVLGEAVLTKLREGLDTNYRQFLNPNARR